MFRAKLNPVFSSNHFTFIRFAIKTVDLCRATGLLVVGGMAGQLVVCSLDIKREFDIPVTEVDIMEEDEDFVWKGQGGLGVRSEPLSQYSFDKTL